MKQIAIFALFMQTLLYAHFQTIIPTTDIVNTVKTQTIELSFMHPFEQTYMQMEKPEEFGFYLDGKKTLLTSKLKSIKKEAFTSWTYTHKFKQIGDYLFFVKPKHYFEPSEGKFIQHLTKTIIDAHNAGEGWDKPMGLKAEIVPLSRPYGLYKGNIFSGVVLFKGKPVPNATIEVEHYNSKNVTAPTESHITQIIKTDSNGVFHYGLPKSGWWGFAALIEDDIKIKKDGKNYPVELGGLIWIKVYE